MKIEEYKPAQHLKSLIKAYKIIESRHELVNRVLPGTAFAMAFRIKGKVAYLNDTGKDHLPKATFSGLRKTVRLINYAPETATLVVLFSETGAAAFFKQPLYELFEKTVSLDNFFPPSEISFVEERLSEADNSKAKVAVVEQFLWSKLMMNPPDEVVSAAIAKVRARSGMIRIKDLADGLYISQDAFEKRFRKAVGATPKQFASIVQMQTIIQNTALSPLLDLALDNGYYDQSHFNKAFKLYTGQTPIAFFKSPSFW